MAPHNESEICAETSSVEPARKPWAAPQLIVSQIEATTLAAAATIDDGSNGNLLAS